MPRLLLVSFGLLALVVAASGDDDGDGQDAVNAALRSYLDRVVVRAVWI